MEKEKVNFENCFEEAIKRLKENAYIISTDFMREALEEGQENKYKNLVNALSVTLDLIDRYSWQLKWSKFRDENGKQYVSIWEQDINGQIRNNNTFLVDEVAFKIGNKFLVDMSGALVINGNIIMDNRLDKYIKTSNNMIDLFKEVKEFKKSRLIYTDENMRNIGKTYSLYNILKSNDNTILLTNSVQHFISEYTDIKEDRIVTKVSDIRGIDLSKIVLIDDIKMTSEKEFKKLDELGILYCGYRHIGTL